MVSQWPAVRTVHRRTPPQTEQRRKRRPPASSAGANSRVALVGRCVPGAATRVNGIIAQPPLAAFGYRPYNAANIAPHTRTVYRVNRHCPSAFRGLRRISNGITRPYEVWHLYGPVPSCRREPHSGVGTRPGAGAVAGLPGLCHGGWSQAPRRNPPPCISTTSGRGAAQGESRR